MTTHSSNTIKFKHLTKKRKTLNKAKKLNQKTVTTTLHHQKTKNTLTHNTLNKQTDTTNLPCMITQTYQSTQNTLLQYTLEAFTDKIIITHMFCRHVFQLELIDYGQLINKKNGHVVDKKKIVIYGNLFG